MRPDCSRWWEEVYDSLQRAPNEEAVFKCADAAAEQLGFRYSSFGVRWPAASSEDAVMIYSSYPVGWMEHYREQEYLQIDPTVALGMRTSAPIVWTDGLFAEAPRLWSDARACGLRVGLGQSSWGACGSYGLFSLARESRPVDSDELDWLRPRLRWVAATVHQRIWDLREIARAAESPPVLSRRQQEVLRWTAQGKTAWEIARILAISENTVNFHIKNIVAKLGVQNKSHAAAKAAALGLFGS